MHRREDALDYEALGSTLRATGADARSARASRRKEWYSPGGTRQSADRGDGDGDVDQPDGDDSDSDDASKGSDNDTDDDDDDDDSTAQQQHPYVGREIRKKFPGVGTFEGEITREDLYLEEVEPLLTPAPRPLLSAPHPMRPLFFPMSASKAMQLLMRVVLPPCASLGTATALRHRLTGAVNKSPPAAGASGDGGCPI